jgi:hypothetical protein
LGIERVAELSMAELSIPCSRRASPPFFDGEIGREKSASNLAGYTAA